MNTSNLYEEALEAHEEAIRLDPKSVHPWYGKGKALYRLGRYEEALEALDEIIRLDPWSAYPWYGKGYVLDHLGRYEEALEAYDKAIRLDPKSASPWNGKGNALCRLGRYKEALEACEEGIRLDPKSVFLWNGKGNALRDLGRYEEALEAYDKAIRLDPKSASPWNGKGNALRSLGRYKEALEAYEEGIGLDPKSAPFWYGKGDALRSLGRYEEALEAYDKAIRLDPKSAFPWNGKGNALHHLGRYKEALEAYEEGIGLDPQLPHPWFGKARVGLKHSIQNALPCINRSYYLNKRPKDLSFSSTVLDFLKENFYAPFLVWRIFQENPVLQTYVTYAGLLEETIRSCEDIHLLIAELDSESCTLNRTERLKLKGIIAYYLGDPVKAYDEFNELDTEDESDLCGQAYLIRSGDSFCEDVTKEAEFALDQAVKAQQESGSRSNVNLYYAGHIFDWHGDTSSALECFATASEFLPALYMQALMLHKTDRTSERDGAISEIIKREKDLSAQRRKSFLRGVLTQYIDPSAPEWDKPMMMFAYAMEISGAIRMVNRFAARFGWEEAEISDRTDIAVCSWEKDGTAKATRIWLILEKEKQRLRSLEKEAGQERIERIRLELISDSIPVDELGKGNNAETERQLAVFLDSAASNLGPEPCLKLIHYLYYRKRLSLDSTALMTFYVPLKIRHKGAIPHNQFAKNAVMTTLTTLGSGIAGGYLLDGHYQIVLAPLGAGLATLTADYVRHCAEQNRPFPKLYARFKNGFYEYFLERKKALGREFANRYGLSDDYSPEPGLGGEL